MSTSPSSDLALRVLRIEQQLDSYERLHMQELDALRRELSDIKQAVLSLARAGLAKDSLPSEPANSNLMTGSNQEVRG